eukprot:CAMPEP_0184709876 /NCGR_PEP_ID=MMETSP0314-20130426/898_1 /TAXON_ID=38298 /ORGANISM="Rhodella maculata, Strain CCMP 736" /LENGTH=185 /DNA_ID=CAMNT_0027171647 /DNA_START=54 /DNA_END=611 /DNA_ORIENTATION=+
MSDNEATKRPLDEEPWCPDHTMNIVEGVDKEFHAASFHTLADAPVSALQGLAERADVMMAALGVKSVRDLAEWKFAGMARAIVALEGLEVAGKREAGSLLNCDLCLDKESEVKSLKEVAEMPPSCLQGLTEEADALLKTHHVTTVRKLAEWKYIHWAMAIVALAEYEETDGPNERKKQRMLKKLE